MRTVVTTAQRRRQSGDAQAAGRRARVVIRRFDPWSVLKFSLLFYFCLMLVFMAAMVVLYWALGLIGVLDSISNLLSQVWFESEGQTFEINGGWLFGRLFVVGLIGVAVWSLVNTLVALLYNLIADIVGGIKVTLGEGR